MKMIGGTVDVAAATAFRKEEALPAVRLTVQPSDGSPVTIFLHPQEARGIGLDLIGAGHAALADVVLRVVAKQHGLDGDSMIGMLRDLTDSQLGVE